MKYFFVLIATFILLFISLSKSSQVKTLIDIKDINYDHVPDTLVGTFTNGTLRLDYILWGIDSTIQAFPKDYNWVDTTKLVYPNWIDLKTFNSVSSFNLDTIQDIMIFMNGKIEVDSSYKDTSSIIIIYGQYGFDSVSTINLTNVVYPFQLFPIKLKHIQSNQDITNCRNRGFDFTKYSEFIKAPTHFPPPFKPNFDRKQIEKSNLITKIYPNPTNQSLTLNVINFDTGKYLLDVYTSSGELILQQSMEVVNSESDSHFIDISRFANGVYYIIISRSNALFAIDKFIKNN